MTLKNLKILIVYVSQRLYKIVFSSSVQNNAFYNSKSVSY